MHSSPSCKRWSIVHSITMKQLNEVCERCPLVNSYRISPTPDKEKKYALILDAPDMNEAAMNKPFSSKSNAIIVNIMKKYGLNLKDFYLTYAVKCNSPNSSTTDKASRRCREILYKELETLPNLEYIITFGSVSCNVVTHKRGSLKKNLNLPKDIMIKDRKVRVIPTVHPNHIYHDPETVNHISQAFNVFTSLAYDMQCSAEFPEIIQIKDETTFKDAIEDIRNALAVGFDVETTSNAEDRGLRIFDPSFRILTVGFAIKDRAYWINVSHPDDNKYPQWAKHLLELCKHKIVAHNRTFDVLSSIRYFNIHDFKGDDTLVKAYLLDENGKKGLKHLASMYLGWHDYDNEVQEEVQKTRKTSKPNYEDVPLKTLGIYNALDAAATLYLNDVLEKKLDKQSKTLYKFLMRVQNMYIECSLNGMPVDMEYIAKLKKELKKKADTLYREITEHPEIQKAKKVIKGIQEKFIDVDMLMSTGKIRYIKDVGEVDVSDVEINLNSRHHLMAILAVLDAIPEEQTATGGISTSKSALESLNITNEEHKELFHKVLEYRKVVKLESTFIKGLLKQVYPDNKVHSIFSITNTVTGRTTSSSPNVQQIPRDKEIKNIFYAPEGYKIVQYDFAQAEIRVMASFANDEKLLQAITSGADIHIAVASLMFDIPIEKLSKESPERQIAKSCSFGILYGTGPTNLAKMIGSTREEAQEKINMFMERFPKVREWIRKTHTMLANYGYVTTPFGRKRRLPGIWSMDEATVASAKRQAQNAPIQATASDLNLWLLTYIHKHMDKTKSSILCSVHDSGVFMVHDSYLNEFIALLKKGEKKMNENFTFLRCPIIIDIQVGQRWGQLKDIEEEEEGDEIDMNVISNKSLNKEEVM